MQRTVTQVTLGCWRDRNELAEDDFIAVGSEDGKLASAAELVDAPCTSALGRVSSLGLEFSEEARCRERRPGAALFEDAGTRGFATDVGVAFPVRNCVSNPKNAGEESHRPLATKSPCRNGVTWMKLDMAATRAGDNTKPAAYRAFFFLEM